MSPIIPTKLYIPKPRPQAVFRQRLTEKINEGAARKLTLVSASAGYGKTTLASEWLSGISRPAAWLSLDEGDNDFPRFMAYVVAAMRTIDNNMGSYALQMLQSPQPPPADSVIATLLGDLVRFPEPFILVLDDYHVIHSAAVHDAVSFLLNNMPPRMHLAILTRTEPDLPLARLRVMNEVNDLSVQDLRFDSDETAAFLNDAMNLGLSMDMVSALKVRTEGWIAGLQIAAVSMQGHTPTHLDSSLFSGSHGLLLDYLIEEVLHKQPEPIRKFLLHTSILDRLCGPLCDAILQNDATVPGNEMLVALERANLFIVPLDHQQQWYRYHPLFAESLRKQLQHPASAGTESLAQLHVRASAWYEKNELSSEAFRHATAANDIERAARLAVGDGMPLHLRGEVSPVLNWLESLPAEELDRRPSLWVIYGSALLMSGKLAGIEPKLQAAEAAMLGSVASAETRKMVGLMAATRAALAAIAITGQPAVSEMKLLAAESALREMGDTDDKTNGLVGYIVSAQAADDVRHSARLDAVIAQSRRAMEYLAPEFIPVRMTMEWLMGVAFQLRGDRSEAKEAFARILLMCRNSEANIIGMMAEVGLGSVLESENRLYEAAVHYEKAVELAGNLPMPASCEAYLGLARIFYEWNDLEKAARHAQHSVQLAAKAQRNDTLLASKLLLSRIMLANRDWGGAVNILEDANRLARTHSLLNRLPEIADVKAMAMLQRGDLPGALLLSREHRLPLSLCRVYLANGDTAAALAVLEPYRLKPASAVPEAERLKALIVQAVVLHARGEIDDAVQMLNDALWLAEAGGCIRSFIDEGTRIVPLLEEAAAYGRFREHMEKLLEASEAEEKKGSADSAAFIEPLTQREREILQLIADGLSNREIGQRLFLALDTVKGHNRRIFGKLQAQRRTEAIAVARKLGWIEP